MNCRGHETRKKIVEEYDIKCSAHIKLLNGQHIESDAGADITDNYYVFICKRKTDGLEEKIQCGEVAAHDFLQLANIEAPPIFNMLHGEPGLAAPGAGGAALRPVHDEWNNASKQLYNAIMILITAWDLKPGPIYKQLEKAIRYRRVRPYSDRVEHINNILQRNGTTMREILDKLLADNPRLKDYQFDELIYILNEDGIPQYFETEP